MRSQASHLTLVIISISSILCAVPFAPVFAQTDSSSAGGASDRSGNGQKIYPGGLPTPIGGTDHKRRQQAASSPVSTSPAPMAAPVGSSTHKRRHEEPETGRPLATPVGGSWHRRRHQAPTARVPLAPNVFVSSLGPLPSPSSDGISAEQPSASTPSPGGLTASAVSPSTPVSAADVSATALHQVSASSQGSQATPEPGVLLLFGTGIVGLAIFLRQRRRLVELAGR